MVQEYMWSNILQQEKVKYQPRVKNHFNIYRSFDKQLYPNYYCLYAYTFYCRKRNPIKQTNKI